jgi:SAM-dependent methyltransferase
MAAIRNGYDADVRLHLGILHDFDHQLSPTSTILDFGCGEGFIVDAYRAAGFQAVGTDVILPRLTPWLHAIDPADYRLPFDDETFDFIFSNSVLEHVQDLRSAFLEIHRVLKPGGVTLHLFPPPGKPIEPHVHVPFAGLFRPRWWLLLWAALGVRNVFQQNLGWRETERLNRNYLETKTCYRSRRELQDAGMVLFSRVEFADREMIRNSYGNARYLAPIAGFIGPIYGAMHQRCLVMTR